MARTPQSAEPLDAYARLSNRARFLEETSHGILELLRRSGRNRAWLARRMGCKPSMITKVLEGSHNFEMETLADITLALGRAVHVSWGADLSEMRVPRDETTSVARPRVLRSGQTPFVTLQEIVYVHDAKTPAIAGSVYEPDRDPNSIDKRYLTART